MAQFFRTVTLSDPFGAGGTTNADTTFGGHNSPVISAISGGYAVTYTGGNNFSFVPALGSFASVTFTITQEGDWLDSGGTSVPVTTVDFTQALKDIYDAYDGRITTNVTNAAAAVTAATNAATSETNAATSATTAGTAATTATTQAGNAATSATTAGTAATNAGTSETNAATSATTASTGATTATTQAGNAATSATTAGTAATTATTQAGNAATSATTAGTAATNAGTSETNAATSATTASTAATNAGTSETNAATSATTASTAATTATTQAGNAATSATNAATSETNAATSATTASTAATNAGTSETNAATSATTASGAATTASAARDEIVGTQGTVVELSNDGSQLQTRGVDEANDTDGTTITPAHIGAAPAATGANNEANGYVVIETGGRIHPDLVPAAAGGSVWTSGTAAGEAFHVNTTIANAVNQQTQQTGGVGLPAGSVSIGADVNIAQGFRGLSTAALGYRSFHELSAPVDLYRHFDHKHIQPDTFADQTAAYYGLQISDKVTIGSSLSRAKRLKRNVHIGPSVSIGDSESSDSDHQVIFSNKTESDMRNVYISKNVKILRNTFIDENTVMVNGSFRGGSDTPGGLNTRNIGDITYPAKTGHSVIYVDDMLRIGFIGKDNNLTLAGTWSNGDAEREFNVVSSLTDSKLYSGYGYMGVFNVKHATEAANAEKAYWRVKKLRTSGSKKNVVSETTLSIASADSSLHEYEIFQVGGGSALRYSYSIKMFIAKGHEECSFSITRIGVGPDEAAYG